MKPHTVGDLFILEPGFAFKSRDFKDSGTPVLKIKNVKANAILLHDLSHVDEEFLKHRPKKIARKGDLLITMSGNRHDGTKETWVGKVAEFRRHETYLINQRVGALRPKEGTNVNTKCCGYFLSSDLYQREFIAIATSSGGQANISPDQILSVQLNLPSRIQQDAIADFLGALDDKIENNRAMNETLEEMARAIFKSWFVDFDPVHAKSRGEQPAHMDAETAALFPDRFGDDGLPEGWSEQPLSNTISLIGGGTPKTKEESYWNGDIGWFSVVDAPNTSDVWVIETEKKITEAGLNNSSARLLPEKTTIVSARGTVGKTALTFNQISMNQSCYGITGAEGFSSYFTYFSVRRMINELRAKAHGSVFDTITRDTFDGIRVPTPTSNMSVMFDECVENIMQKILANLLENQTLAELRDTLLPKLMSGEIRIKDAERQVGAAV